jgi:hypothetical protein
VSVTISPPIRVFAVLGIIAAAGLGLFLFMLGRSADTDASMAPVTPPSATASHTRQSPETPARPTHRSKPQPTHFQTPASGFPKAVDRAFRKHRVVVLVVYMPGSSVDAVVRKEARAGAIASRAGYVPVSALNGVAAGRLVAKTGVLPDPAVVVVRRPGVVAATLGVTDRETVEQAVAQAKR